MVIARVIDSKPDPGPDMDRMAKPVRALETQSSEFLFHFSPQFSDSPLDFIISVKLPSLFCQ